MKEYFPNYYEEFKCIADKCTHSCCIGWEIDIDDQTLLLYNELDTPLGERIRRSIDGNPPHFVLSNGDRCPFLNSRGLCDIISECGEDALCDICYLHPRFRNFYSECVETGLGASCEEAARIILGFEETVYLSTDKSLLCDSEKRLIEEREKIFAVLQNRSLSVTERFFSLAGEYKVSFDKALDRLCTLLLTLERLDERWTDMLSSLKDYSFDKSIFDSLPLPFEQMAVYFIFRHMIRALDGWEVSHIVNFALTGVFVVGALCEMQGSEMENLTECFRMYSSEIEYSEENTEALLLCVDF